MTAPVIELKNVSKTYRGKIHALRGVDLLVEPGEVFGLLGPNGAGKSTLIKILMTVIKPSSCTGTMLGKPVGNKATLAKVGYLPEHHRFPPYLKGAQVMDFYGAMLGMPRKDRKRRGEELLDTVGIARWAKTRVGKYSKGMRQRLGIAQALIADPALILLDEPTDGVDPVGRRDIRDLIAKLKDEKRTVFLNSHLLSELEMVCDRVAILVQGLVRSQGTIDDLTADQRGYEIRLAGDPATIDQATTDAIRPHLLPDGGSLKNGRACTVKDGTIHVDNDEPKAIQPLLSALLAGGLTIASVRQHRPSLEDLFMQAVADPTTGGSLKPGAAENAPKRQKGAE